MKDEELSDIEDLTIHAEDAVIIAAHSEDDVSHLDMYVYEESEDNLYVHHDIIMPTFPLCLSWMDYNPKQQDQKGTNFNDLELVSIEKRVSSFRFCC